MSTDNPDDVLAQDKLLMLAEGAAPVSVDDSVKARMKQAVLTRIADSGRTENSSRIEGGCPTGGKTIRGQAADWFQLSEDIAIKVLHQDRQKKIQTALWRLKPGAVIKGHKHSNDEECLVMEGSIQIDNHILHAGDYHRMAQGSTHDDIYTKDGALLFLRHDLHEHLMRL